MVVVSNACVIYIFYCINIFIDTHYVTDHPMANVAIVILLFIFYVLKSPKDDQADG
jgi:hypothetical protein